MRFLWLGLLVVACSSSSDDRVVPPPPSDAGVTTSTTVTTFAVDELFIGDTDPTSGALDATAWQKLGYDLDRLTTTSSSTNGCVPGSSPAQVDGLGGIDNAWGALVVPRLVTGLLNPGGPTADTHTAILAGQSTTLFRVVGLGGVNETVTGLMATASMGASVTPPVTSSTSWPSVTSTNITFSRVYAVGGTVVATDADGALPISIVFSVAMTILVHHPVLTFRESASTAVEGTIAGTLDTAELLEALHGIAGRVSLSLCGAAFDGITTELHGFQDIMLDTSNAPGVPCNAISIGMNFTAKQIANDTSTVDVSPPINPCTADAGLD